MSALRILESRRTCSRHSTAGDQSCVRRPARAAWQGTAAWRVAARAAPTATAPRWPTASAAAVVGAPAAARSSTGSSGVGGSSSHAAVAASGAEMAVESAAAIEAQADLAAAEALLQWACHGWAGPERQGDNDGDCDEGDGKSGSGAAAAASDGPRRRPLQLRVAVRDLGPGRGRGLVAAADVAPGETLLSVPLTRVFSSATDTELHWSAEMALRLLRARHLAAGRHPAGLGPGSAPGEAGWGPWICVLPGTVRTPLEYGDEEVRQLGCPYVMEEVRAMQHCVRECFRELQGELTEMGCGWEDFLWAVQIFHSRCFFEPGSGLHIAVPGVDLANHAAEPSAAVALRHSPAACQGWDAVAEVAEPPPLEPSRFELVAGDAGIRCGEEVTISYGRWPGEAFLLLFGFVPARAAAAAEPPGGAADGGRGDGAPGANNGGNGGGGGCVSPDDSLMVFRDAEEAAGWCVAAAAPRRQQGPGLELQGLRLSEGSPGEEAEAAKLEAIIQALKEAMPDESFLNLGVTCEGVDGRLQNLLVVAARQLGGVGPWDLLRMRLQERLADFDNVDTAKVGDEAIRLFVRSKRELALHCLTNL